MGSIRLILALGVVFAHAPAPHGLEMTGGVIAVQMFFVISGFYMAMILAEKYPPTAAGRRLFWGNRILRLAPCYFVVLLAAIAFGFGPRWLSGGPGDLPSAVAVWRENLPLLRPATAAFLALVNVTVIGQDFLQFLAIDPLTGTLVFIPRGFSGHLLPAWQFQIIPQAWTLALELMFYASAPWLVRRSTSWLTGAIILSFAVRVATYLCYGRHDPWTYRFFPSEIGCFLLGLLAYRWLLRIRSAAVTPLAPAAVARTVCITVVGLLVTYEVSGPLVPVIAFAAALPWIFTATSALTFDREIGELSYPVYLVHLLLLPVTGCIARALGLPYSGLVAGTLALIFAVGFRFTLDRPIALWRQRRANVILAT